MRKINEDIEIGDTGMPLGNIKTLLTEEDLNNILIDGNYYCGGTNANLPVSGYSVYLEVKALNQNYLLQRATRATKDYPIIYERQHHPTGWTDWVQIQNYAIEQLLAPTDWNTLVNKRTISIWRNSYGSKQTCF